MDFLESLIISSENHHTGTTKSTSNLVLRRISFPTHTHIQACNASADKAFGGPQPSVRYPLR